MIGFLELILPATGYKVLDYPSVTPKGTFFRHKFFKTSAELFAAAKEMSDSGHDVYHACASFIEPVSRKAVNVEAVKAFWIDLDVGEGASKYESQEAAVNAIIAFAPQIGLPAPTLVSSGYGIHVYWPLTESITPAQWVATATAFKQVLVVHGIKQDLSRTSDVASILRTPGTVNLKFNTSKPVEVLYLGQTISYDNFDAAITKLIPKNTPVASLTDAPAYALASPAVTTNEAFATSFATVPSDPLLVAAKCGQIGLMRDTRGAVPEPHWYASIGVLRFCENATSTIHDWSKGHSGYSEKETDDKIRHSETATTGPTTCAKFEGISPDICAKCPSRGKITTPLHLGRRPVESKDVTFAEELIIKPPYPFFIDEKGRVGLNVEDKPEYISPYPFYFKARFWSVADKEFCYLLRYWYPQDGWQEVMMTSYQLGVFNDFNKAVAKVDLRMENMNMTYKFLNAYADQLKALVATQKMVNRQGWHDESFVLGETIYHRDGSNAPVTLAPAIVDYRDAFRSKGTEALWVESVKPFAKSLPHAFGILVGFAAPMMKFTSYDGAVVNMLGETGCGKSTVQQIAASIYGDYKMIDMKHADTAMSKFRKIGVFSSLPATIDEITNIHPDELSAFIYQISQGRERNRLKSDGAERNNPFTWQTIVLASSNKSIYETLSTFRADTTAEAVRALEISTPRGNVLTRELVDEARILTKENFGLLGPKWISHIVSRQAFLQDEVRKTQEHIFKSMNAKTHHRYWVAVISCAIVAAKELKTMGLFDVDIDAMTAWLSVLFVGMEKQVTQFSLDAPDMFASWLNENMRSRLIFDGNCDKRSKQFKPPVIVPDRELCIRIETASRKMFIAKKPFLDWLDEHGASPTTVLKDLYEAGIFVSEQRMALSAGWSTSAPLTKCFVLDLDNPFFKEPEMLTPVGAVDGIAKAGNM